jgi:isopenicillin N synthase-like dioxygenase
MRTSVTDAPATPAPRIPTVDLGPWLDGGPEERARIARTVDEALQSAGFLLVTGHGVDPSPRARIRTAARAFFILPAGTKLPCTAKVGGRGWLGPGAEANGCSEGTETPPDLRESLTFATDEPFEDPVVDAEWYAPNVRPTEVPELRALCEEAVPAPVGRVAYEAVDSHTCLREKLDSTTVG